MSPVGAIRSTLAEARAAAEREDKLRRLADWKGIDPDLIIEYARNLARNVHSHEAACARTEKLIREGRL